MKQYMLAFIMSVVAPLSIAYGATNNVTNSTKARSTTTYRRASTTQKNGPVTTNFYYNQSGRRKYGNSVSKDTTTSNRSYSVDNRSADSYTAKSYTTDTARKQTETVTRVQKKSVTQERKYFLAHPFFQPLKGRFGSVTDVAMSHSSMDFDMLNGTAWDLQHFDENGNYAWLATGDINVGGKAETNQFLIKQDFSFGLTDEVAIIAMGQYDSTKWKLKDWSNGNPEDKSSDSGINVFGFGAQVRFLDVSNAIGMTTVHYESQRDTADSLMADLKLGYKFDRTTLYLVGRGGYSWLKNKNSSYGFFMEDDSGDWFMLSYKRNVDDLFYAEGGLGVFSVLNKYFTVNAEAFFGNYDWHNQLTAKAAFGIQPFDSFALNVYASGVLYDSGEGKTKEFLSYDVNPVDYPRTGLAYTIGDYKIKNYSEYKFGAQVILHF